MTSQDRGNLLHAAHRRAKLLGLSGADYERALDEVDEKPSQKFIQVGDHPPEFVSGDTPLIVKAVDLRNAAYVIRNYCDALRSPASAGVREALRFVAESGKFQCFDDEAWDIVNSALSDHGVHKSAGSWRPIESAPRDGTGILVKLPDSDMPHTAKFWRGSWTVAWDHSELKGWDAPTHWMPIPELPSDSLLSKTLTEVEKRSIATKQSTDPEGNSRTETTGGAV